MSDEGNKPEAYVLRVTEAARQYSREMLEENERLRHRLVLLESENTELRAEIHSLSDELTSRRHEAERLSGALAETERDNQRFLERYLEVERESASLAHLYVASYQLHGATTLAAVRAAMREILANLVGCERFGVYELSTDGSRLELVDGMGLEGGGETAPSPRTGVAAEVLRTGRLHVAARDAREGAPDARGDALVACVPLELGGRTTGVLALYELLPQKRGLEEVDREILELLGAQAARALECARLRGPDGAVPPGPAGHVGTP
ncbi:MAG: GAF domain-containing protein [Polyangiaceae bacterium]|nr:GAF domain-containing protein [Polyangiaceae bacterium]